MQDLLYVYHPPIKGKKVKVGYCFRAKNVKVN